MYSDNQRRASASRANDEFLRRMVGGELTRADVQVMNVETPSLPNRLGLNNGRANGSTNRSVLENADGGLGNNGRSAGDARSTPHGRINRNNELPNNSRTRCDGTVVENGGVQGDSGYGGDCPTHIHAPALAMVYAPRQCWRNLLDPQSALENGTLFADLVLPLEVGRGNNTGETEAKCGRC